MGIEQAFENARKSLEQFEHDMASLTKYLPVKDNTLDLSDLCKMELAGNNLAFIIAYIKFADIDILATPKQKRMIKELSESFYFE